MKKWIIIIGIFLWLCPLKTQAKDIVEGVEELWFENYFDANDVHQIDQLLSEIFPGEHLSFYDLINMLLDEEKTLSAESVAGYIGNLLFGAVEKNRNMILFLFIISILSALFSNFANAFQNQQIATIGLYIIYLLTIQVCLQGFQLTISELETSMEQLLTFMKFFSPIYFLCMTIAVGSVSSIAFYNIVIWLIYFVELIIFCLLLPFVQIYLVIQILNFISEEDALSKCSELIKNVVDWGLKFLLACVTGVSLVQSLLTPAIDTVKRNALTKGVEMIPGLGNIVEGTGELMLGIVVLIKNGVGTAGAIIIVIICVIPIANMFVVAILFKCLSAVIQPLAEKRYTEIISCLGEGYFLLLKIQLVTGTLFLITIGVAIKAAG